MFTTSKTRLRLIAFGGGGGTGGGDSVRADAILPANFYFKTDATDGKLSIRGMVNSVDQQVFKFGSGEADIFKSNKIMGGFRQIKSDGTEYFLIRQSTAGDMKAVSVGNMDTDTPNSLVCGKAGWRESRLLQGKADLQQNLNFVKSTNSLGGTRLTVDVTSDFNCSWRKAFITLGTAIADVKYNARIYSETNELLSDHQMEAEFMAGAGLDKFKKSFEATTEEIPLSQPFPVPKGAKFKIVYDFDKQLDLPVTIFAMFGIPLELSRIQPTTTMTRAEVTALTAEDKWSGRKVIVSDEQDEEYFYSTRRSEFVHADATKAISYANYKGFNQFYDFSYVPSLSTTVAIGEIQLAQISSGTAGVGTATTGKFGIARLSSTTAANSGFGVYIAGVGAVISSEPVLIASFKTPSSNDSTIITWFGTSATTPTGAAMGFRLVGTDIQCAIRDATNDITTSTGIGLSASTWYIVKVTLKSNGVSAALYTDDGTQVSTTFTLSGGAIASGASIGVRSWHTGATTKALIDLDYVHMYTSKPLSRVVV